MPVNLYAGINVSQSCSSCVLLTTASHRLSPRLPSRTVHQSAPAHSAPAQSAPAQETNVEDPVCDPVGGSSSDSDDETPAEGGAAKPSGKSPEDKLVKVGEGSKS